MKKLIFLLVLISAFLTVVLFADEEEAPSEDAKVKENAEPAAEGEVVFNEETKPEENKEEQHSGGVTVIEKEIPGKNIVTVMNIDRIKGTKEFSGRSTEKMTWDEAVKYCDKFTDFNFGFEKWRLPTVDELRELVRNCSVTEPGGSCRVSEEGNCLAANCSSPKNSCTCERKPKNRGYYSMFGDADYIGLWSSSTLSDDDKKAWGAVFYSGMIGSVGKDVKLYARCVHTFGEGKHPEGNLVAAAKKENKSKNESVKIDKKNKFEPAIERDVINKLIREKNKEISWCINKGAREDNELSHGMLWVEIMISPDGKVAFSNVVMSTFGNLTIENCIAEKIKEIKFPAPKHGAVVISNHSMSFRIPRK